MATKNPAQVLGSKGGKARAANLGPDELTEIGKKGAAARWEGHVKKTKKRAKKKPE